MKIAYFIAAFAHCSMVLGQQFMVLPYIQPGNASDFSRETKVIIWQTDDAPGSFTVSCTPASGSKTKSSRAKVSYDVLNFENNTSRLYRATLPKLKFDQLYTYEVRLNDSLVSRNTFRTRTKKEAIQFAFMADCGGGTWPQAAIASQIAQRNPDFVLIAGDIAYQQGLVSEYQNNFFPYYLSNDTIPSMMSTVPFYMLIGNHDVYGNDLDKDPEGLGYFYFNDLPLNGPRLEHTLSLQGADGRVSAFMKNNKRRFPRMLNFSFDYGNVHFICMDANSYVNPLDPAFVSWLREDIASSTATWKIVSFHHPGFNSSESHRNDQYMRLLSPLFEQLNVDLVLNAHVHNYQRTVPLRFAPKTNEAGTEYIVSPDGKVEGVFTLDNSFDGVNDTTPEGITYIISGAGGGPLYDTDQSRDPELWSKESDSKKVQFTKTLVSDIHSFTWIETKGTSLVLKQFDLNGVTLDQITITK